MTPILAIDVGTLSLRAALFQPCVGGGMERISDISQQALALERHAQADDSVWIEQQPAAMLAALRQVVAASLAQLPRLTTGESPPVVRAAIASQRSTVIAWRRSTGNAIGAAISWQDTRGAALVRAIDSHKAEIQQRSGLVVSPHYGASKLLWLLGQPACRAVPQVDLCCGPLISYLLFHLLEGKPHCCDHINAARTQLLDINSLAWSPPLARYFAEADVPSTGAQPLKYPLVNEKQTAEPVAVELLEHLPRLVPVIHTYGELDRSWLPETFSGRVELVAATGDQNAAFYACLKKQEVLANASPSPNRAKNSGLTHTALINAGTGAFLLAPADLASSAVPEALAKTPLLRGLVYSRVNQRLDLLEGTVNGAGAALDWLFPVWQSALPNTPNKKQFYQCLAELAGDETLDWVFINTIGGLGSPFWRAGPQPCLLQLSSGRTFTLAQALSEADVDPNGIAAAVFESIVFLLASNLAAMQAARKAAGLAALVQVVCSGGISRNPRFAPLLAALSGVPIVLSEDEELTLAGAALLAVADLPELASVNAISDVEPATSIKPNTLERRDADSHLSEPLTDAATRALGARYASFRHKIDSEIN